MTTGVLVSVNTALRVGRTGPSRRHLSRRVGLACLLVRHTTSLVVAVLAAVADDDVAASTPGWLLLISLGSWSFYRLVTRSQRWQFTAADFCWVVAVACSVGLIVGGPAVFESHDAAEAIVGVGVATFVIEVRPGLATPMTVAVVAAYAWGLAQVVGWHGVGRVADLYYLIAGWSAATAIRMMSWRIAGAVDVSHEERQAAEIARSVSAARRDYDREQLALLHDTAAATLLMVGQGARVADDRLAAQARRDLELLEDPPWISPAATVDIVAALRTETAHLRTAVQFTGHRQLRLRGDLAGAVVSAAREVINNVDRHAQATTIRIGVQEDRVVIADDGIGFTPGVGLSGHGIRASVVGRMNRVGGTGSVRSAPAQGTVAELSWPARRSISASVEAATDADRLIGRLRGAYTLALTAYAIAGLVAAAPPITAYDRHPGAQVGLLVLTGVCALSSVPAVFYRERRPAWVAAFVLAVISFLQPALLTTHELSTQASWAPAAVGFCLLPLLLRWPTGRAAGTLLAYWFGPAVVAFLRDPGKPMLVFLGLSFAGTLIPQMFATLFSSWAAQAARDARAEHDNLLQVVTAEKVASALQADHLKRYADVMAGVIPLLRALSRGDPVTDEMRRQARAESRRLRTLFDRLRADHPLLFEIRSLIEAAEDRGVEVAVHFDAELPAYAPSDVERIVRRVERVIGLAAVSARIVVTAAGDEITVSVVSEVAAADAGRDIDVDGAELTWSGQTVWMTTRQRIDCGARS